MRMLVLCRLTPPPAKVRPIRFLPALSTVQQSSHSEWITRDEARALVTKGYTVEVADREFTMQRSACGDMIRVITGWNAPVRFEDRQELIPSRWP